MSVYRKTHKTNNNNRKAVTRNKTNTTPFRPLQKLTFRLQCKCGNIANSKYGNIPRIKLNVHL